MHGSRADKVAELIKSEVGMIVGMELKDPRVGFVTITRVELSDDLKFARIFFSKMGSAEDKKYAFEGLTNATGFIKKLIGERLSLRYVPEVVFKLDESAEYSQHIEEVLKKIKEKENPPSAERPDTEGTDAGR